MVHLTEENDFIVLKEMNICLANWPQTQISFVPTEYCFDFRNSLGSH
jgi:hypothetical protein